MEKYYNDAVIGNQNIVASYTKNGEILRIFYPNRDYKQIIDFFHVGLKINDSGIVYMHQDINNIYEQYYEPETNILNTEILNTYFNLKIKQTDYCSFKENLIIKKYKFINESTIDLNLNLIAHSGLISAPNNRISGLCKNDTLMQYNHEYTMCTFSKEKILSSQINNTKENIRDGQIGDKDYVGMSADSSISYDLGTIKPNEIRDFELYIYIDDNKNSINNEEKTIERRKKLTNHETGGIAAAVEIDENLSKCGGYDYCWPRDAVFITYAMDILKLKKEVEKFYKNFCKNTQNRNGMWEQRFFTDGRLAPCWGYQIDETASVIFGVYNHYLETKEKKFLNDNLKMCEKATTFLEKYITDILSQNPKMHVSYDLWEMHEGISLYSIASIFAAFNSMIKIYDEVKEELAKNRVKQEIVSKEKENLRENNIKIKEYILKNFYDENKKSFIRNLEDKNMDISILGLVIPFEIFTPKEKKITNTVERINMTLRTYTGGYKRFEQDHYMGGKPWVIATLWMANYYIEIGEKQKAKECFDFVIKTSTKHGFLAEQIDNETMKPAWVIGLGWSHAMFIIVLKKMIEKGLI